MKDPAKALDDLANRERVCWEMARVFLEQKDAHGIMDMGAELQALRRARKEVEQLKL